MPAKRLFVAATRQNDGKTMVSLGLYNAFQHRYSPTTYMKPVGQQYREIDGQKIDKDAVLFSKVYDIKDPLHLMSPVAVPRGFTRQFIEDEDAPNLCEDIVDNFETLSKDKEFVLIEGTGHAGVGSVFKASNGQVADALNTKVVLVSPGGLGKAIDEIALNKACFDKEGVEIIGVIANKIQKDKYDRIVPVLKTGLRSLGLPLLGAIPFETMLSSPSILEIKEGIGADILAGADQLSNKADRVLIGAMAAHDALNYFEKNTLLIVPGNREGVIMTALYASMLQKNVGFTISGMVFTGGIEPNDKIFELVSHANIPILLVNEDSYSVAAKINNLLVKLRSNETEKIKTVHKLIDEYIDVDQICELL